MDYIKNEEVSKNLRRQVFRDYFQPSRIVLGVLPAPLPSGVNLITLCFTMYTSYKPNMMAFSIQKRSYSFDLIPDLKECVLSIPGESMATSILDCGTLSGHKVDKIEKTGLTLVNSKTISVPSIAESIANIECEVQNYIETGDHRLVVVRVKSFNVNMENNEKNLVSVGSNTNGYKLLVHKGIHRIGVIKG